MTKDDFQKSATYTSSNRGEGATVIKFQPKASHILTPRLPMPKSPFGHIMPVAINLKILPTLVAVAKDESEEQSKQDEE